MSSHIVNVNRCECKTSLRRKAIHVRWKTSFAILKGQIDVRSQQPRGTKYDKDWNNEHEQHFQKLGEDIRHRITCEWELAGDRDPALGVGSLRERRRCVT